MTSENLTQIFELFGQGLLYGIPLGTLVWMLGTGASFAYNFLFRQAN